MKIPHFRVKMRKFRIPVEFLKKNSAKKFFFAELFEIPRFRYTKIFIKSPPGDYIKKNFIYPLGHVKSPPPLKMGDIIFSSIKAPCG